MKIVHQKATFFILLVRYFTQFREENPKNLLRKYFFDHSMKKKPILVFVTKVDLIYHFRCQFFLAR